MPKPDAAGHGSFQLYVEFNEALALLPMIAVLRLTLVSTMYRVLSCITAEHDYWLLCLAVIVCVTTALTSFLMYSIADASSGRRKLLWAALTGVSAGAGIWSTHFVAMLAYKDGLPTHYEPVATIGSLLIAMAIASLGFAMSTVASRIWIGLGGVVIGIAIGTMHFTGMAALVIPGSIQWDTALVIASWVLGCAIAGVAMLAFHSSSGSNAILRAAGLLTLAICVMHFTAMGAVEIQPDPTVPFDSTGMNRWHLALAITAVTFIVLLSTFAAAVVQRANLRYAAALQNQNAVFEAALRYLPVGLSMYDKDQRLIMCNPAYRQLYGLPEEMMGAGTKFSDIFTRVVQANNPEGVSISIAQHLLKLGCGTAFTETITLDDGRTIFKKVGPIASGGWVDVQEDITARVKQEAKIAYMAEHDMLTSLPNRPQLIEQLDRALRLRRRGEKVAVLFMDLDRFKSVNDTHGHLMGDKLLKAAAERLRNTVRHPDIVGRLGGDEFVVVQVTASPGFETAELASRIVADVGAQYDLDGQIISVGVSVGIAISRDGPDDNAAMLARADAALYKTKSAGGTAYSFYEEVAQIADLRSARRDAQLAVAG